MVIAIRDRYKNFGGNEKIKIATKGKEYSKEGFYVIVGEGYLIEYKKRDFIKKSKYIQLNRDNKLNQILEI